MGLKGGDPPLMVRHDTHPLHYEAQWKTWWVQRYPEYIETARWIFIGERGVYIRTTPSHGFREGYGVIYTRTNLRTTHL
jgi:hypothetical protein